MFNPEIVYDFTEDEITQLGAESDDVAMERSRSTEKLKVLEVALRELRRLDKHRPTSPGKLFHIHEAHTPLF
jgi:hypothetical protein